MMGRELIVYILENNLENEPVIKDGNLVGFMNLGQAAEKFDVGTATIEVWVMEGFLPAVALGGYIFIPVNAERPTLRREDSNA